MIRKYLLLYFTISLTNVFQVPAQDYWKRNYKAADEIASKTKKSAIIKLSKNLTSQLPDTIDKYRAIFTWMAQNISYDVKGLEDYSKVKTDAEDVLSSGKSVCEGYANLFDALCKASGLGSASIGGWTKNNPEKIGKPFAKYTTHAWNAIRINKKWYLCDVTWGSGSIQAETGKFKKEFSGFYFCMPNHIFFLNHYPEDQKWFLGYKVNVRDFINLPHFFNPPLEHGIENLSPENGTIKYKKGETIKFEFTWNGEISNILVNPTSSSIPYQANFKRSKNKISFEYKLDKYAPFLFVYVNNAGALVYRMER